MRIGTKLYLGFIATILFMAIVGIFSSIQINRVAKPLENDIPRSVAELTSDSNLNNLALLIKYYDEVLTQSARNYAFTSDNKWKARYYEAEAELDKTIKFAIEKSNKADNEIFERIYNLNTELVNLEATSIDLADSGNNDNAIRILDSDEYLELKAAYFSSLEEYFSKAGGQYKNYLEKSTVELKLSEENARYIFSNSIRINVLLLIIALLVSIGIGSYISRDIREDIKELVYITSEINRGNFKVRTDVSGSEELKFLGNSINTAIESLEKIEQEQKQLDNAKTKFLSITSHELRSPMTPTRAQLQMLLEGYFGKLNKKQRESLEIIIRNIIRLDRMIQDLLEISRIEAARLNFNFLKTNLKGHIQGVVKEMGAFLPQKKIKITTKIAKLPLIEVDPDRVMQVLRNLINNAKKFSPKGSRISIEVKLSDGMVQVSVHDQGAPIKPEVRARIFEPFYKVEQRKSEFAGAGLGLALCKGIVESQNGRIWIESGKGNTFYFTIPLEPVRQTKPIKLLFSGHIQNIAPGGESGEKK